MLSLSLTPNPNDSVSFEEKTEGLAWLDLQVFTRPALQLAPLFSYGICNFEFLLQRRALISSVSRLMRLVVPDTRTLQQFLLGATL